MFFNARKRKCGKFSKRANEKFAIELNSFLWVLNVIIISVFFFFSYILFFCGSLNFGRTFASIIYNCCSNSHYSNTNRLKIKENNYKTILNFVCSSFHFFTVSYFTVLLSFQAE